MIKKYHDMFCIALCCFMMMFIVACDRAKSEKGQYELPVEDVVIQTQSGARHVFHAEIAATAPQLMKGLMNRTSMPDDHGMLFLFAQERERNFWMKNTLIPLDILYIKANGVIHHIHKNAQPMDLTPLPSNGAVLNVLEINGGMSDKLGINSGDIVFHGSFGNSLAP